MVLYLNKRDKHFKQARPAINTKGGIIMVKILEITIICLMVWLGYYSFKKMKEEDPQTAGWITGMVILVSMPMALTIVYRPILGLVLSILLLICWFYRRAPLIVALVGGGLAFWLVYNHYQGIANLWMATVRHYYGG